MGRIAQFAGPLLALGPPVGDLYGGVLSIYNIYSVLLCLLPMAVVTWSNPMHQVRPRNWFYLICIYKKRIIKVLSVCYIFYSPPASSLRDINLIEWTTKTNHRPVVAISRHDKRCFVMLLTWADFVAYWKLDPTLVHSKPPNNQIRLSGSCKNP